MEHKIDLESYQLNGKGYPVIRSIIKRFRDEIYPFHYNLRKCYKRIAKILGNCDDMISYSPSKALSTSFFDMEPLFIPGKKKFIVYRYKQYSEKGAELITPIAHSIRLGKSYILIFVCQSDEEELTYLDMPYHLFHEYLFTKDESGKWTATRKKEDIETVIDLVSTAIALGDIDWKPSVLLPF